MKYDYDIIIIGAGSAGLTTAQFFGRMGLRTLLFEKHKMGGDCLNDGCVPSKSFIKATKVANNILSHLEYGLNIEPTMTSLCNENIMHYVHSKVNTIAPHDSKERYESFNVDVILEEAHFVNKHTVESKSSTYTSKYIIIATGSSPRIPNIPGLEEAKYLTNTKFFEYTDTLSKSIAIIGFGFIGAELGQSFLRLGMKVHMIDNNARPVSALDKEASHMLAKKFIDSGASLHLERNITHITTENNKKLIYLDNAERIEVDEIFVCAGRRANIDSLTLGKAGIYHNNRRIIVDKYLRTNHHNIYAIGDVNGLMPFTHAASWQASIAIRKITTKFSFSFDRHNIPYTVFTEPEISQIGYTENECLRKDIQYKKIYFPLNDNDRAICENDEEGYIKILLAGNKLLGATIAGHNSGEILPLLTFIKTHGISYKYISSICYSYPTVAEALSQAVLKYRGSSLYEKKFLKKLLKILV